MHQLLFFITLSLLVSSCNDDPTKAKIPSDAIERDKFVNILADIHLMDAVTNNAEYFRKYEASDSVDLYSSIFEKYNVSKVDFDSTVSYYTRKPEIYLEVYDEVIYELNLRLDSLKENVLKFEKEEQQ